VGEGANYLDAVICAEAAHAHGLLLLERRGSASDPVAAPRHRVLLFLKVGSGQPEDELRISTAGVSSQNRVVHTHRKCLRT
jgi:hypothetical protein